MNDKMFLQDMARQTASPAVLAGARLGQVSERRGSVRDAFEGLSQEVEALEQAGERLYSRLSPILEPENPGEAEEMPAKVVPISPLAESLFESTARLRRARFALNDILGRIAF